MNQLKWFKLTLGLGSGGKGGGGLPRQVMLGHELTKMVQADLGEWGKGGRGVTQASYVEGALMSLNPHPIFPD